MDKNSAAKNKKLFMLKMVLNGVNNLGQMDIKILIVN